MMMLAPFLRLHRGKPRLESPAGNTLEPETMDTESTERTRERPMGRRRITLVDGRYMIFYTFGSAAAEPDTPAAGRRKHDDTPDGEEDHV